MLVGRELQKDYGQESQDVMVLPLLVGLDGKEKMSKSLDNYIGIAEPADIMYEKVMKIPDNILFDYFKLTTDLNLNEVEQLMKENIILAHQKYAEEIIKMYHGEEYIKDAAERYNTIASGGVPKNIDIFIITLSELNIGIQLTDLLLSSGIVSSKSEGRRMIEQRGISLNGKKETDVNKVITINDFINNELIIQKGKKKFKKIAIK